MKVLKYSVGIDVSKSSFHACLCFITIDQAVKIRSTKKFNNNPSGFFEFLAWVEKNIQHLDTPLTFVMEATGIYYENLALYLLEQKERVSVVLPNKAKKYMQSLGLRSKNDSIDAKGLARMGAEQQLQVWLPKTKSFYQLRTYTRHLEDLQKTKTSLNNQLEAVLNGMYQVKEVVGSLKKAIKTIDKQIENIQSSIVKHVENDDFIKEKVRCLTSIKGIGTLTAAVVIAETNGFQDFNNQRQLVSYSGYDIIENQSGSRVGKTKISKKGNSHIRRILHMAAFTAVRYNQKPFVDLYERVYENSKIKMKAYVAVQKKLLCIMFALYKKGEIFIEANENKGTSGNDEQKLLSPVGFGKSLKSNSPNKGATQDELPYKESQEVLSPVKQI